jgi:hypothetical protein
MKTKLLFPSLFFVLFCNISVDAQSQKSYSKLITTTNQYLEKYSNLSPYGSDENIAYESSGLSKADIKYLKKNYQEFDGYTIDSISEFNLLLEFQGLIIQNLTEIMNHERFLDTKIEEQLSRDYDLAIVVSNDRKLFNFSLDEKTGGSYRSRISITYFTEDTKPPYIKGEDDLEIINQHGIFDGDGFDAIYTLNTKEGTKYLIASSVRGCNYCFETSLMLVSYNDGAFIQEFYYSVNSRDWEEGVFYNEANQTIDVDYFTDDLTTDCDCINAAEDDYRNDSDSYWDNAEELPFQKKCSCTFKFNGTNFELTKESWERVEE